MGQGFGKKAYLEQLNSDFEGKVVKAMTRNNQVFEGPLHYVDNVMVVLEHKENLLAFPYVWLDFGPVKQEGTEINALIS